MNLMFGKGKKRIEPFPKTKPQRGYEKEEDIPSDVDGSYTGIPLDEYEVPVQDVDDL